MVVKTLVAVAALFLFAGCDWRQQETLIATDENITPVQVDLADIRQRGKLVAITGFNPLSYFIYKGTPMGYDYELLKMFAEENDIELELLVVHDLDSVFHLLNNGKGDIIGYGMNITKEGRRKAAYAQPFMQVHQVLVQRKPETGPDKNGMGNTDALIRDIKGLAGKSVHVKGNSVQMDRLFRLIEEIGVEIDIVPLKGDMSADDLIRKVAEKEIDYTVADENAARLASTYFSNIDVETFVSDAEGLSWAVRRNSPELLHALNDWFTRIQKTEQYNLIYKKYFTSKRQFAKWAGSDYYFSQGRGKISEFDEIIKRHAQRIGWDWRLLAAIIYEESQFETATCSWAGAEGLMQLMPQTGLRFGSYELSDPEQNIRAGASYLRWLAEYWKEIPDSSERLKFILASYNAGEGHVQDAVRLSEKYYFDPCKWDGNVAEFLRLKSKSEYYNDPLVTSGYCRGGGTVKYVKEVLELYKHYSQIIAV